MSIYLNGKPITVTLFPDNTSQVWKLDQSELDLPVVVVKWEFFHEGEFMQLAQLKMLLDDSGVLETVLFLDYLPYGRQDKPVSNSTTFALWPFASLINHLNFTEVIIKDPHSDVALRAIWNSSDYYPENKLLQAIEATNSNMICYPDRGARIKYTEVYEGFSLPWIYGEKVRDQTTGHITNYELKGSCEDKIVMIVDDICDGGKTFELLAKELFDQGAENVHLFVTHGIFSKGIKPLKLAGIDQIFTSKGRAISMSDGEIGYKSP